MRQDKTFARILLIYSVANVAIAAPAAVRQRHLDVAKAAPEKRASDSGGDLLPESSSAAVSGNGATGDPPPGSSTSAANRITTQALGASGLGNGATGGDLPTESSLAPANHITTQALGASGSGNEATDNFPPESSSSGANRITTQALGASGSNGATGDLPPESSSAAANRITTQASKAPGLGNGETSNLPPESSSPMPPHERPMDKSKWDWLLWPDSPKASSASSGSGNGATGDLSRVTPQDKWAWLYHGMSPESSSSSVSPHDNPSMNLDHPPLPESPPASSDHITTPASRTSSSSNVFRLGDLHLPPPWSPDQNSAAASEAGHAAGWHLPHFTLPSKAKLLFYSGAAVVVTGIAAYAYGVHRWLKNPYVSPLSSLSCGHLAESQTF